MELMWTFSAKELVRNFHFPLESTWMDIAKAKYQ
jgi:hypothetical protein